MSKPTSRISEVEPDHLAGEAQDTVEVDHLEVRLPCRSFRIAYKVSENSEFSLATEFLLRLLRNADGMLEEAVGEFFGFTADEIRFVVDHVENAGYVHRGGGRVYLSDSGHALFAGGDEPRLFEVNSKQELFDFDLVAFAPADPRKILTKYEYELPELSLNLSQETGQASQRIFQAFAKYFQEFRFKRGGSRLEKQSLYTVDEVQPELRYSSIIPVRVVVRTDDPSHNETDLSHWRTGPELEDRALIIQSCGRLISSIRSHVDDTEFARQWLVSAAPDQVERFVKGGSLDALGFFRACVRQAGELRVDRPTVRIVGRLWTDANRTRVASALKYAAAAGSDDKPQFQIWIKPSVSYWGMSTRVPELLSAVEKHLHGDDETGVVRSVLIGEEHPSRMFEEVFDAVLNVSGRDLPSGLEVYLISGQLCYIGIHSPVGCSEGYPIPLGILSFDAKVLATVQRMVAEMLSNAYVSQVFCDWGCDDVRSEVLKEIEASEPSVH